MATGGKVVIVTGSSRGIGLAVAKYLLGSKNKVILVSRTVPHDETIQKGVSEKQAVILSADLSDLSRAEFLVKHTIDQFGRLDGLVLNHGTLSPARRIEKSTVEEWRKVFDINFFSGMSLAKAALPHLRKSKGKIIFTSSGAATNAYSAWGAYGSSKAALNHLAQTLAAEEPDIISIAIRPGIVDTEMQREVRDVHHEHMDEKDAAKFKSLPGDGRLLKPEQPGNVIARLVLDAPAKLNGKFLTWNDDQLSRYQDES